MVMISTPHAALTGADFLRVAARVAGIDLAELLTCEERGSDVLEARCAAVYVMVDMVPRVTTASAARAIRRDRKTVFFDVKKAERRIAGGRRDFVDLVEKMRAAALEWRPRAQFSPAISLEAAE